jgi:UDP-N-acetyl-D-glucosamine dehydrogenase
MPLNEFTQTLKDRTAKICIVGLGYVGLPLVKLFRCAGFDVLGLDIDADKIAMLGRGESYIRHLDIQALHQDIQHGHLLVSTDYGKSQDCTVILLCVPTPLNKHREPDLSHVENTALQLSPYLRPGQLIVLESTTYPGTTVDLLIPALERQSPLKAGNDFFVAYSPEREDPGNPYFGTQNTPKIVGGFTQTCATMSQALYQCVVDEVVAVSTPATAEMTKLLENIFRGVNIALVNELKILCQKMNINIWEVIQAAATKPFGFMPFYPGPGLGGHCIPVDPFYLTWKAREFGLATRFIELAGEVNRAMPEYIVDQIALALNEHRLPLKDAQVLILGVAYKKDVDDVRESPALEIIEILNQRGAQVRYHDPHVPKLKPIRHHNLTLKSVDPTNELIAQCNAVVIVTDHQAVDYQRICEQASLVVDTRNVTAPWQKSHKNIYQA